MKFCEGLTAYDGLDAFLCWYSISYCYFLLFTFCSFQYSMSDPLIVILLLAIWLRLTEWDARLMWCLTLPSSTCISLFWQKAKWPLSCTSYDIISTVGKSYVINSVSSSTFLGELVALEMKSSHNSLISLVKTSYCRSCFSHILSLVVLTFMFWKLRYNHDLK